jgi:Asp-tRNA(Asn)/Glu-tRNA(Gln) amidotransferase A subunit family amidase
MSVTRREFGQTVAAAAVSMSLESDGVVAQSTNGATDLVDTAGIRTTHGTPFYRDRVPDRDAPIVARTAWCGQGRPAL